MLTQSNPAILDPQAGAVLLQPRFGCGGHREAYPHGRPESLQEPLPRQLNEPERESGNLGTISSSQSERVTPGHSLGCPQRKPSASDPTYITLANIDQRKTE